MIGIFDSSLGGLSVLRALRARVEKFFLKSTTTIEVVECS